VVSGYVIGQMIISAMFGTFSYVVLFVLDVPQPLLLSLFGAVAVAIRSSACRLQRSRRWRSRSP
ncbi:MAG TPA: hypothetical protein VGR22_11820, partial [Thermomicrobiales bacterium]|nr:hypothetical protein [Thermomicrobiales bacterium]